MKISFKKSLIPIMLGTIALTACSNTKIVDEVVTVTEDVIDDVDSKIDEEESTEKENKEYEEREVTPSVPNYRSIDDLVTTYSLTVLNDTTIKESPSSDSADIKSVLAGDILEPIKVDGDYVEVSIGEELGYILISDSDVTKTVEFPYEYRTMGYLTEDTTIYSDVENTKEVADEPTYEVVKIYETIGDKYLVEAEDNYGYINSSSVNVLDGTYAIVDISDQELNFYKDNELVLTTPVVTGKPSTPTDIGAYDIYNITDHRYLVGPTWKSYVDYMMKFNGGQGLHDAEYHTNEDGKSHGWRDISEFGGDTYLTDGSHGCVNMPHDAAEYVYDNVEVGDKVLVKN